MFKDGRFINAGENEVYRFGKKARAYAAIALTPNEKGFYSIPADADKYWTIGTSKGKYGEFARFEDTCFSVNSMGMIWAKVGSAKEEPFIKMVNALIAKMNEMDDARTIE